MKHLNSQEYITILTEQATAYRNANNVLGKKLAVYILDKQPELKETSWGKDYYISVKCPIAKKQFLEYGFNQRQAIAISNIITAIEKHELSDKYQVSQMPKFENFGMRKSPSFNLYQDSPAQPQSSVQNARVATQLYMEIG